jgi:hypothetical protein
LGYDEATKLLVDEGALISAVDRAGCTARDLAEEKGMGHVIDALDDELSTGYIFEGGLILF